MGKKNLSIQKIVRAFGQTFEMKKCNFMHVCKNINGDDSDEFWQLWKRPDCKALLPVAPTTAEIAEMQPFLFFDSD